MGKAVPELGRDKPDGMRKTIFTSEDFPFLVPLEEEWSAIRDEIIALQDDRFSTWPEKGLYDQPGGWKIFGLVLFGRKHREHCALCPRTVELLENLPGLLTAGFSRLAPGTEIKPHRGRDIGALRCHLGLVTPENCGFRVGNESYTWKAGECMIFDDTMEHEAWNHGDEDRIVLLVDFRKDPTRPNPVADLLGVLIAIKYRLAGAWHRLSGGGT